MASWSIPTLRRRRISPMRGEAMSIRKIIALLWGGLQDRSVLDCCAEVARRNISHVEAVHLSPGPAELEPFRHEYYPDFPHDMSVHYRNACRDLALLSHGIFEAWREESGFADWDGNQPQLSLTANWREDRHSPDLAVRAFGRFCDLIVAPRPEGRWSAVHRFVLEGLLFASGHPALLIPPACRAFSLTSAVIAWNGSAESVHAVTAALPLLRDMRQVNILQVLEDGTDRSEVERLAGFLRWHQIEASIITHPPNKPVGVLLLNEVKQLEASLLVMGAYTHSPTREQLLGGATLHILQHAEIPVLMAH
jgi:nucleotide-binding universal stress UspA family protein